MADVLYFNGRFTTTDERVLGVEDRGFQFGDAVYEVFKFVGRRPVLLPDHYRRMEQGLREIEIPSPWSESAFTKVMADLLGRTGVEKGIVYIQVSRGEAPRAHFWPEQVSPTVVAYSRAFVFPDAGKQERGIDVITVPDHRWHFCNVKSVNLLGNAIAKKSAQRGGADEALLIAEGLVREGASSNFFAVKNGGLVTHPLDAHILAGVVRNRVITLALGSGLRVDERPLREAELFEVDEAFITSTTQGVMPVTKIDGRVIGSSRRGSITATLQQSFDRLEARDAGFDA